MSIRFRIMTEAEACVNVLNAAHFPDIEDGTLSMVVHLGGDEPSDISGAVHGWRDGAIYFGDLTAYRELDAAFTATEPRLSQVASAFVLRHPLNGSFFVARIPLNW